MQSAELDLAPSSSQLRGQSVLAKRGTGCTRGHTPPGRCKTHQGEQRSPSAVASPPCLLRDLVSMCWSYFVLCSSRFRACDPVGQFPLGNRLFSLSLPGPHLPEPSSRCSSPPPGEGRGEARLTLPPTPPFHLAMPPTPGYTLIHAGKWKRRKPL